jgi:hypothetical protein
LIDSWLRNLAKKMELRKYNQETDYETLAKWFEFYGWNPCPKDSISPDSFFVVENGVLLAFSGVYLTNTTLSFLGFTISNPMEKNKEALDFLLKAVFEHAKKNGAKLVSYFTDSVPMVKRLTEKHGMDITDNGTGYILLKQLDKDYDVDFLR